MANSDYNIRTLTGPLCPSAVLTASIGRLDTGITVSGFSAVGTSPVRVGSAAMIGQEIVSVLSVAGSNYTLGRGCCDTIPAVHAAGERIWFFDDFVATDGVEYAPTETVSVKPLPKTVSNIRVPVASSPPTQMAFNWRFARPYPPGNVRADAQPWFNVIALNGANTTLNLSWAHRDRVTQQDTLIAHAAASIGPEPGTTYNIRIHRADNNAEVAEITGITGTSFDYSIFQAVEDFSATVGVVGGYLILESERGGLASWQQYRIDFTFDTAAVAPSPTSDLVISFQRAASVSKDLNLAYNVLN